jgi:hypothetical protein
MMNFLLKEYDYAGCPWLRFVILATQEAEIRRVVVEPMASQGK